MGPASEPPRVIGIDDWAWRKGQRYGTMICDLERRQVIDLLPDREPATVEAWLRAHPGIRIIGWLNEAEDSMIASFARGLRSDCAAVTAALREPWSNGQTEGQINRLKTLKRQMYAQA